MNLILYYTPETRAVRPRWLLEELGLPYTLRRVDLRAGEQRTPEYLAVNPFGQVPALEIDGEAMLESGAICHWLTDRNSDADLAPPLDSPLRRDYERWMFFAAATLETGIWLAAAHSRLLPEEIRVPQILPWSLKLYRSVLKPLDAELAGRDYLVGAGFTTADILVGSTLMWSPESLKAFPNLRRYVDELAQRPAYRRATRD